MFNKEIIEKYADVLVRVGLNIQKGQTLFLQCCPEALELARAVSEKALQIGAKDVRVNISDPYVEQIRGKYLTKEQCAVVPQWMKDEETYYLDEDGVQLALLGTYPDLMNEVSDENAMALAYASNELRNVVRKYIHAGEIQWCGTALPTLEWARKVYPELEDDEALKQLENDIIRMMRLDHDDPIQAWNEHCQRLKKIGDKLNAYQFQSLHLQSELGTDLTMDLVENHIWCSAADEGDSKVKAKYIANMPTEEIFTDPHCDSVNGIAYASKPLIINGKLVKDFWIRFENGLAVDCGASQNVEFLRNALFKDDRTRRLGEVAFVSKQSVINQTGRLYYNGLIDENAASHLAFGTSFPSNIKGGSNMSTDELIAHGVNVASSHNDFMVGTEEYHVEGITHDGQVVVIMDHGDFVI